MVNSQSPFGTPPPDTGVNDAPAGFDPPAYPSEESEHGGVRAREAPIVPTIPPQRAPRRAKRVRRGWVVTLVTVVGLIPIAACGAGTWFLVRDNLTGPAAAEQGRTPDDTDAPESEPDPLSSRETDTEPLTASELFGGAELATDGGTYSVHATDALPDCGDAATGTVAAVIRDADCSQVVRATVIDAEQRHAATLGVVNLPDADAANRLREHIADGSAVFTALRADGITAELGLNPTVLGFNTLGHYLLYAVIGRADGESPSRQDDEVSAIVGDLVDSYLVGVLESRRSS